MAVVYWCADCAGNGVGSVFQTFVRWIRANDTPELIINGGDVYNDGADDEFDLFLQQVDGKVSDMCETPGNHDWRTRAKSPLGGKIPSGYEKFWGAHSSQQPIDTTKITGARYEHSKDIGGWRFVFLDTGPCEDDHTPWPVGNPERMTWLRKIITEKPGRATMVFAHHSRLSFGKHGDIEEVDALWQALFDGDVPRVSLTMAGHDHNVSVYGPRPRTNPSEGSVDFAKGVHVVVSGAGGRGHDAGNDGTRPDPSPVGFFDDDNYCLTRINLLSATAADVEILSFGPDKNPPESTVPTLLHRLQIRL